MESNTDFGILYVAEMDERLPTVFECWRLQDKVGDILLPIEPDTVLGELHLARVVETFPGQDERVRSLNTRCAKGKVYKRSVQRLVVLTP